MDSAIGQQLFVLVVGAMLAVPGIVALYIGVHRNDEERNRQLQLENYANEIRRLQIMVDEQQRKISELETKMARMEQAHQLELSSAKGVIRMLFDALKRVAMQAKQAGVEPAVDLDAMGRLLP